MFNRKHFLYLLVIALLPLIVFSGALQADFVNWDDDEYVTHNPLIRSLSVENIKNIFTTNLTGKYHPLTLLSFAFEYHFVELDPFLYHATNLFIHILNVLLVFAFVSLLMNSQQMAFIAAILFAIHPLNVEPVAWVSSRKDMLFMFFYLSGMIFYLKAGEEQSKKYLGYVYACFICSLLSKAMAITFPLALIALDYLKNAGFTKESIVRKWDFFLISIGYGLFTLSLADKTEAFPNTTIYSFGERILYSFLSFLLYMIKVIAPYPLSCYYAFDMTWMLLALTVVIVLLGAVLIMVTFRHFAIVKFSFLFYCLTIWPVLHLLEMNDSLIYERFMYLPALGFYILIAYGLIRSNQLKSVWLKRFVIVLFSVWLAGLIHMSTRQVKVWNNSGTLWANAIKHFPKAYPAYNNMGLYLESQLRFDEAMLYFMRMVEVEPKYAEGYFKLANILALKFDRTGAIRYYSKAVEYNPKHYKAFNNRGNQYLLSSMYDKALEDYSTAVQINNEYIKGYLNRGMCYLALQDHVNAIHDFRMVLKLDPDNRPAKAKLDFLLGATIHETHQ